MGGPDIPATPNPAKTYEQGIQTYLKFLPQLLAAEQDARTQYDPQRIAEQQQLQAQYGPTQYGQQLDALHQLDPWGAAQRVVLGGSLIFDLADGRSPPPDLAAEWAND